MPSFCPEYVAIEDTHSFSAFIEDYLAGDEKLKDFYEYAPNDSGLSQAIEARKNFKVNRQVLVDALQARYTKLTLLKTDDDAAVSQNILRLSAENTFTICTAHQPNLLTGYLYFIYKIIHAIRLAQHLQQQFPDNHFVPVYYMGSEDNDLEELGKFFYDNEKFYWNAQEQTGAVGRMRTSGIEQVLTDLFKVLGPPGDAFNELENLLITAYEKQENVADATQYLVHHLFKKYGLVILNADDGHLKKEFSAILKDELLHQSAHKIVEKQSEQLGVHYTAQAFIRPINLFYLKDEIRARIELHSDVWKVVDTDLEFSKAQILEELEKHPERFSPNVILRGLYQESILPNVAFVGGGSEVAYWMQLKTLFNHYKVHFPALILRQSVLLVNPKASQQLQQLKLEAIDLFQPLSVLKNQFIKRLHPEDCDLEKSKMLRSQLIKELTDRAVAVSTELGQSVSALNRHIEKHIKRVEEKLMRNLRKQEQVHMSRLERLKNGLFPTGTLQERKENFIQYYPDYGSELFDALLQNSRPYGDEFLILYIRK